MFLNHNNGLLRKKQPFLRALHSVQSAVALLSNIVVYFLLHQCLPCLPHQCLPLFFLRIRQEKSHKYTFSSCMILLFNIRTRKFIVLISNTKKVFIFSKENSQMIIMQSHHQINGHMKDDMTGTPFTLFNQLVHTNRN